MPYMFQKAIFFPFGRIKKKGENLISTTSHLENLISTISHLENVSFRQRIILNMLNFDILVLG